MIDAVRYIFKPIDKMFSFLEGRTGDWGLNKIY